MDEVRLNEDDLPANFHDVYAPETASGAYVAGHLDFCRALAESARHKEALKNPESLAALSVIC